MTGVSDFLSLIEPAQQWVNCLLHPVDNVNRMLRELERDRTFGSISKVWTPPLLISAIISVPVYNLYGISWTDAGFHLPTFLIFIFIQIIVPNLIHVFFRLFRLGSDLHITLAIYSIIIIYCPVFVLITTPASMSLYSFIESMKHLMNEQNVDITISFSKMWPEFLKSISHSTDFSIFTISQYLSIAATLIVTAAFAELTIQRYDNPRFSTYMIVNFVGFFALLSEFITTLPLQLLTFYSSIK